MKKVLLFLSLVSTSLYSETKIFTGRFFVSWCGFDKTINKNKCLLENKAKNIYVSAFLPRDTKVNVLETYNFTGAMECEKIQELPAPGEMYGRKISICTTDKIRITDCELQVLEMTRKYCEFVNMDSVKCSKHYSYFKKKYCGEGEDE